jgi:F0F1-type ATP synthase assembly protein I
MAFNNPPPDPDAGRKKSAGIASLVQAEKLTQIAFILPCAMLVGWGAGWWVDRHFHVEWATITGLVIGLIAGMVSVVRMALGAGNSPGKNRPDSKPDAKDRK